MTELSPLTQAALSLWYYRQVTFALSTDPSPLTPFLTIRGSLHMTLQDDTIHTRELYVLRCGRLLVLRQVISKHDLESGTLPRLVDIAVFAQILQRPTSIRSDTQSPYGL